MALPTLVNVLLALEPNVLMAVMQTTMIRASMTAYSTAVGPSSRFKKSTANRVSLRMSHMPFMFKEITRNPPVPPGTVISRAGRADGAADVGKRYVGVGAERADGGD